MANESLFPRLLWQWPSAACAEIAGACPLRQAGHGVAMEKPQGNNGFKRHHRYYQVTWSARRNCADQFFSSVGQRLAMNLSRKMSTCPPFSSTFLKSRSKSRTWRDWLTRPVVSIEPTLVWLLTSISSETHSLIVSKDNTSGQEKENTLKNYPSQTDATFQLLFRSLCLSAKTHPLAKVFDLWLTRLIDLDKVLMFCTHCKQGQSCHGLSVEFSIVYCPLL